MSLKITAEDLDSLKNALSPLDTPERRERYLSGDFPNAQKCRDLDMRYRWDLLNATGLKIGDGAGMPGDLNLYAYLNDDHIDSALRSIVPPLREPALTKASTPARRPKP
jgi:hypothetical protein